MPRVSYPQVVRVYCTYQDPDYENPWQNLASRGSTGSGVVIGKGRILTGAHVVANATFLQVQKPSDPNKVVARIVAISHDRDLALLEVDDPSFTRGIRPAEIGQLPRLRDEVSVIGYPVGGDELSITEGVVSRIEVQRYEHSQRYLLAVTVDAAINEGNSGGPVFCRGKVVGVAFQALTDAENIGEMVPAPVIKCFLDGVAKDKAPDVPGLGISTQNLENAELRRWLGMKETEGGVLITGIQYGTSAWKKLQKGDVLLEIGGMKIASNGTVRYRGRFRCQFDVVLGEHFVGDKVEARILRAGKRRDVTMTMRPMAWLVPRCEFDKGPTWFVFGGLVFASLTAEYLRVWGESWWDKAPKNLLTLYMAGERTQEQQQVVVLAQVLADEINVGYESFQNDVVVGVNGDKPKDLREFAALVDKARGSVVLNMATGGTVMIATKAARKAHKRILRLYGVPADRSGDLQ